MQPSRALLAAALVLIVLLSLSALTASPGNAIVANGRAAPMDSTLERPASTAGTWQEFQHDAWNSGSSPNSALNPSLSWNDSLPAFVDAADSPFTASPAVGQGDVYLPEGDAVAAYNALTGAALWSTPLTGPAGAVVDTTPLLIRGILVVGEDDGAITCGGGNSNNNFYVLNATTGAILQTITPGTLNWEGQSLAASPVPVWGNGFAPNAAFELLDRCGYQFTYSWSGTVLTAVGDDVAAREGFTRSESTPSIAFLPGLGWGTFFLDAGNSQVQGVALSGAAAEPLLGGYPVGAGLGGGVTLTWGGSTNTGSISIANLSANPAAAPYPIGFFGDNAGAGAASNLVAFNLTSAALSASGSLPNPSATVNSGVLSTPAIQPVNASDVLLVVTNLNGTVSGWNYYEPDNAQPASLKPVWQDTANGPLSASAVIAGGVAYVGDQAGTLWALNVATGAVLWSYNTGSPVHGSGALAYGYGYFPSSPSSATATGNLLALGPPTLVLSATSLPAQIASGAMSMIVLHAASSSLAGPQPPVAGATVTPSATFGTLSGATTTDAAGYAYVNWTAPGTSPVWYNETISLAVTATGFPSGAASAVVTVMPGETSGPSPLAVSVTPQVTNGLQENAQQQLTFDTTTTGSSAVAGATLTLTLTGPGGLTTNILTTGVNGQATDTYTAPASIASATSVLLTVSATDAGFSSASTSAVFGLVPPGGSGGGSSVYTWSTAVSPASQSVAEGGSAEVDVTFWNSTVTTTPIVGLVVSGVVSSGAAYGNLVPGTSTTNILGVASFNFTAGQAAGSALLSFAAASGHASASASASIAVSAATPSGAYPWSAVASPATAQIWGGNTSMVSVTFLNVTNGGSVPLVGLKVTATTSSSSSGGFQAPTDLTNGAGIAFFNFTSTKTPGDVLLHFEAGEGLAAATVTASISVFNPASSTTAPTTPGSSSPSTWFGLSLQQTGSLVWLLVVVAVILGLLAAYAFSRRERPEPTTSGTYSPPSGTSTSEAPSTAKPPTSEEATAAAAGATTAAAADASASEEPEKRGSESEGTGDASEENAPITVEDAPEDGSASAPVDHDKLAAGLSEAMAASGAGEDEGSSGESPAPEPESTPVPEEPSVEPTTDAPPSEPEVTPAESVEDPSSVEGSPPVTDEPAELSTDAPARKMKLKRKSN
jgi:hypothetical protein